MAENGIPSLGAAALPYLNKNPLENDELAVV